jgi:hypothetical protein
MRGANLKELTRRERLDYEPKICTGSEMLKTLVPESTRLMIYLRTLLCAAIFS